MRQWLVCLLLFVHICQAEIKFAPEAPPSVLPSVKANPFVEKPAAPSATVLPANTMGLLRKNPFDYVTPIFIPFANKLQTTTVDEKFSTNETGSNTQIKVSTAKVSPTRDKLVPL